MLFGKNEINLAFYSITNTLYGAARGVYVAIGSRLPSMTIAKIRAVSQERFFPVWDTRKQPQSCETSMEVVRCLGLYCGMGPESNGVSDSCREHTERAMVAFRALQRATTAIRFIEENDISVSQFREFFPVIWDDLNKATHYLSCLNPACLKPIFLYN
jgi:hypothetical protein